MAKYHISEDGVPRPCSAQSGNCPVAPDAPHFNTRVEAQAAYEAMQEASIIAPSLRRNAPEGTYKPKTEFVPTTVEPTLEYQYNLKSGEAAGILKESILIQGVKELKVKAVKNGHKNTTLTVDDGGKERTVVLKRDEKVDMKVRELTPASVALKRAYLIESSLEHTVETYRPGRAVAQAQIAEKIQKGHSLSSFDFRELAEAEAKDNVMANYERAVRHIKESQAAGEPDYADITNPYTHAYEGLKKEWTQELLRAAERGESNSTSEISNAFDREMNKAKARFIDRSFWF